MESKIIVDKKELLFKFLREKLSSKSKNNIKSLLRNGQILVNDKLVTKYDYMVYKDDFIVIKNTKIKSNKNEIKIIYEDKDIIVIDKPAGLLTIATNKEKEKTAYYIVSNYLKDKNKNDKAFIVHRLDKDTSGVLLFAKNKDIKKLLQNNWDCIAKKRIYYAVVEGKTDESGEIETYLKEDKNLFVYSTNDNTGKKAITHYKRIKHNELYSLLEIEIITGRKNQIRVHMSDIGHPIVGDKKYSHNCNSSKRLLLHAAILEIICPKNNKKVRYKSNMPSIFNSYFINH